MQRLFICLLLWIPSALVAQNYYDANWVFGENIGVFFNSLSGSVVQFPIACSNVEANASISDEKGDLQVYLSFDYRGSNSLPVVRNAMGDTIINGDSILTFYSATNGAVFLPVPNRPDSVYLIHIGRYSISCNYALCYRIYYSLLSINEDEKWEIIEKNRPLISNTVEESIAIVKHANGHDWWLLVHEQRINMTDSISNKYFVFELTENSIGLKHTQITTFFHRDVNSLVGEVSFSPSGDYFLQIVKGDGKAFLFQFDRCNGQLNEIDSIVNISSGEGPYGCVLLNSFIYLSTSEFLNGGSIYRFSYSESGASNKTLIYADNSQGVTFGQLQLAPDGNIWVSHTYSGFDTTLEQKYGHHISIISQPNSPSAVFIPSYFALADSSATNLGLPSIPNYNLGAEGVFSATAGKDTTWCTNLNSLGVQLGDPPVDNIVYDWQPASSLSNPTVAQPIAAPEESTWYVLTAIDTTAGAGCNLYFDSVYVEVRICTGLEEIKESNFQLYPNPVSTTLTIEGITENQSSFKLYSLLGELVLDIPLKETISTIDLSTFQYGLYFYTISNNSGKAASGKLMIQ